jgi:hypothetical protein
MNNSKVNISQSELEKLIEDYFNGLTTEEQEEQLKNELVTTHHSSRTIDEARAVFGYFATDKAHQSPSNVLMVNKIRRYSKVFVAAASIAICATFAIKFLSNDVNTVYINGDKINSKALALNQMNDELRCIAEASDNVNEDISQDLSLINDAFNENN